jgi:hypothetical protein
MNKTVISQLKRTLKKYGIRNADTIVNQTLKLNYEKFLDYADSLYVIDRIASCYEDSTAVEKLKKANREWIAIVIDKGWCKELDEYVQEFGHKLTLASIYYCIDNDTWLTWVGQMSLRSKNADYWKGLSAIREAAFYLKDSGEFDPSSPELNAIFDKKGGESAAAEPEISENPDNAEDPENTTATATVPGSFAAGQPDAPLSFTEDPLDEETLTYPAENAYDAIERSRSILTALQKNLDVMQDFTVLHADTTDTVKELTKYKTRYDNLIKKHDALYQQYQSTTAELDKTKKELDSLSSTLATRNDELGEAERTANELRDQLKEAHDVISGHSVDMLQSESKFHDLEEKYNHLLDEYEKLDKQEKVPTKKQLKYDDLISLPYIGPAALKQIIPFLERKGILVVK